MSIKYKAGYKYLLVEGDSVMTGIFPSEHIDTPFFSLSVLGKLTAKPFYAWDGPSGPTLDTPIAMRSSLFHDIIYQMLREGLIPRTKKNRKLADKVLRDVMRADAAEAGWLKRGLTKARSWVWYRSVRFGAKRSSREGRPILEAP